MNHNELVAKLVDALRDCAIGPNRTPEQIEIARAALSAAEDWQRTGGWLPIETAPKDECDVLLYQPSRTVQIQTGGQFETGGGVSCCYWHTGEEAWCVQCNSDYPMFLRGNRPTHWQPLPAPPEPLQEDAKS